MPGDTTPSLPGVVLRLLLLVALAAGSVYTFSVKSTGLVGIWSVLGGSLFVAFWILVTWFFYWVMKSRLRDKTIEAGAWPSLIGFLATVCFIIAVLADLVFLFLALHPEATKASVRRYVTWDGSDAATVGLAVLFLMVFVFLCLEWSHTSLPRRRRPQQQNVRPQSQSHHGSGSTAMQ